MLNILSPHHPLYNFKFQNAEKEQLLHLEEENQRLKEAVSQKDSVSGEKNSINNEVRKLLIS